MTPSEIRRVTTQADFKTFFEFPWQHYADDPHWIPPLLSMRHELLDKKKHPAWDYMEGEYFLALQNGRAVGTIVALVNRRHNEFAHENVGWFGMFECVDDDAVAQALLNTATEWVRAKGCTHILGPQNFTTHDETGLLVDNFSDPIILMPYNPPYYQRLLEANGFVKRLDVMSVYFDRQSAEEFHTEERLKKLVERAAERSGITVRPLNPKQQQAEFRIFRDLYNSAWAENWGFVPMNDRELDALIASLGQFVDPKLAFFAEVHGEPAGFSLSIPNLNEALKFAYPRPSVPELWSLLKVAWYWKVRNRIRGARLPLMGVKKEHRNKGVELALTYATFQALINSQYEYLDSGWILETNPLLGIVHKLGAKTYKTHRFYSKPLV